ncbi:MAG TPA: hypothetical protein DCL77_08955 [Prolixibacteraceae bacterium]|jgi:hypothetical protein|nr:hypothetical protein [Prolixibacteraceae bacterium]
MALTYAQIGNKLATAEKKFTKQLETPGGRGSANSARLMLDRIAHRKEQLMAENNAAAQPANSGNIPQFGGGGGVINGFDISRYATDPAHEVKIAAIYEKIKNLKTPEQLDAYIKKVAPGTPLRGDSIYKIANQQGVDPLLIAALMQNDSTFGTKGKGARTFNPGNVGNDDTGREVNFENWDTGVEAVAKWVNKNKSKSDASIWGTESTRKFTPSDLVVKPNPIDPDPDRRLNEGLKPYQQISPNKIGEAENLSKYFKAEQDKPGNNNLADFLRAENNMPDNNKVGSFNYDHYNGNKLLSNTVGEGTVNTADFQQNKLQANAEKTALKAAEMKKTFDLEKANKSQLNTAGVMQVAGSMGTFVDNIANSYAINKMQSPAAPVYQNGVKLNTNFNIEPQLADLKSQGATFDKSVDHSLTSRGAGIASKLAGLSARMKGIGELRAQKENAENQMLNQQTGMNQQINAQNNAIGNNYRQQLVDFNNSKTQVGAANFANFGQDLMDINNDYISNVVMPKKQMEIMMPYLNRYGVADRQYAGQAELYGLQNQLNRKKNGY